MKKLIRLRAKQLVAMGLATALLCGGVVGYYVFNKDSSANNNSENAHMESVRSAFFEKRSEVLSKATDVYEEDSKEEKKDKNAEMRVIVQLKSKAAIDKVKDVEDTESIVKSEQKVLDNQKEIIKKVEKITGNKVENQTGCLINSIVIDANQKEIKKIKKLDVVKAVYESQTYKVNDIDSTLDYTIDDYKQAAIALEKETGLTELRDNKDTYYKGKSTVVAVIDTGINYEHQDMKLDEGVTPKFSESEWKDKISVLGYGKYFSEKVPFGYNYINNDNDILSKSDFHGYHVAGITSGNGELLGVAPNTQIVALKALGNVGGGTTDQLVRAIEDAVKLDVDVINMSLGSENGVVDEDAFKSKAIKKAMENGVLCCISAGNAGTADGYNQCSNNYKLVDTGTINSPGTTKEALTVASASIYFESGEINKIMSGFTSWGCTNDLKLKPEITAPGSNIYALYDGKNNYETLSGTSMASPFVAGCAVLLKNDIENDNIKSFENKDNKLQGKELVSYIKNNLMNTSEPIKDPRTSEGLYSVRVQGAGLVNVNSAVNNSVIATYNDEAKIELGEVSGSKSFDIVLRNYGDKDASYTIEHSDVFEPYQEEYYGVRASSGAHISASGSVIVPAHGEATVRCSLNISSGYTDNTFAEGYVKFVGENTPNLSLPLLAFNGDWAAEPIIDKPVYDEGKSYLEEKEVRDIFKAGSLESKTCLLGLTKEYCDGILGARINGEEVTYDGNLSAISPNGDDIMDKVYIGITQLRNAAEIELSILNKDKEVIRKAGSAFGYQRKTLRDLERTSYSKLAVFEPGGHENIMTWDGKVYDKSSGEYVNAEDGQYYIQLKAKIADGFNEQVVTMPVKIDTKAPVINNSLVSKGNGNCRYEFNVSDNIALEDYMYVYIDGEVAEYKYSDLQKNESGNNEINLENIDNKEVYVMFTDVAGNQVIEDIQKVKVDNEDNNSNNSNIENDSDYVKDDFQPTIKCDEKSVQNVTESIENGGIYVLLNEGIEDKFEFDVACDEGHIVEKAVVSSMGNGGGICEDASDSRVSIDATPNGDGTMHLVIDNSLDWMFMDLLVTSNTKSAKNIILQIYKAELSDMYYETVGCEEESALFAKIENKFITEDMVDKSGTCVYEGQFFLKPIEFTVNGKNVEVDAKTNKFRYEFKPNLGKNTLRVHVKNEKREYTRNVEFFINDMEVKLDIPENDGVIKTDQSTFTVSGVIKSFITGYSVTINGDKAYTSKEALDIDGSKYSVDTQKFSYDVRLNKGENNIVIKVSNHKGQTVIKKIKVVYE